MVGTSLSSEGNPAAAGGVCLAYVGVAEAVKPAEAVAEAEAAVAPFAQLQHAPAQGTGATEAEDKAPSGSTSLAASHWKA